MSYTSADYLTILDLPLSATQDDIKSQYKQLVRTHHPDRFLDPEEKTAAEERLKEINEAYRVLSSHAVEGQMVRYMQREIGLEVIPEFIDFGELARRERRQALFHVHFEKEVEAVDFVPSDEDGWFRVSKVSHLYGTDAASLEFEVEVDTTGLATKTHQGWIDIYLDTTMVRVPISLQVAQQDLSLRSILANRFAHYQLSRRWALITTFVMALLLFSTAFTFFSTRSFSQPQQITDGTTVRHQANQLYFSVLDQGQPSVYTLMSQDDALPLWLTEGSAAAVLAEQQLVAYMDFDTRSAQSQIYLHNQLADETKQITVDGAAKSQLAWSHDGRYLAYLVGRGQERYIGVYDSETAQEYRLPGEITTGVGHFAWSPTANTLLFDLWQYDERRIYRMDVPDGELEQLTRFDSWGGTWSPNADEIIIASPIGLYRMDASGRSPQQINNMSADFPRWSASGDWLAYTTAPLQQPGDDGAIGVATSRTLWLMQPDGSNIRQIAPNALWHAWSPDGDILAFTTGTADLANGSLTRDTESPLYYLWTVTPTGTAQLVAEVNDSFFTWSQE